MQYGVLIVNLGSPAKADKKSVRSYLRQFLSDPMVINTAIWARWILVNMIIVPFRSAKSTAMYRAIWQEKGSPLLLHSCSFTEKVRRLLEEKQVDIPVEMAMRYGSPSIEQGINRLREQAVSHLLVIPMYPHETPSTIGTVLQEVDRCCKKNKEMSFSTIAPFYDHGDYISALEKSFRQAMQNQGPIDLLLFSFHGVPLSHLPCPRKQAEACNKHWNDLCNNKHCYKYQCYATAAALAKRIEADKESYRVAFQSRLGKGKWLEPSTYNTLCRLPAEGVDSVAVMAPSFTADCLETLYELDIELKEVFEKHKGKTFIRIDCLNDQDVWVKKVTKWMIEWFESKQK